MKGCKALLVFLLCLSEAGAQGQNGPGRGRPPTNWELSDMVLVQQEKMRNMEAKVEASEEKLAASEEESKNLKMSVAVTAAKLTASETQVKLLQSRLNTSEGKIQDMNEEIEDLTSNVTTQQRQTEAQQITLNRNLGILKRRRRHLVGQNQKVAFSAALMADGSMVEQLGSDEPEIIMFKKVFCNHGGHYAPTTGVFTAPERGVYFFTFTIKNDGFSSHHSGAQLVKGGDIQVSTWWTRPSVYAPMPSGFTPAHGYMPTGYLPGYYVPTGYMPMGYRPISMGDMTSQTVILELHQYETVNVMTWGNGYQIYDSSNHYTTFSGFLLFPLP